MAEILLEIPDEMEERLRPMSAWLSAVLELGLCGLRTPAVQTASEIVDFLAAGPAPSEVLQYHVSDRAQTRLHRLLALQTGGQLSLEEQAELDELGRIEHILIRVKAGLLDGSPSCGEKAQRWSGRHQVPGPLRR